MITAQQVCSAARAYIGSPLGHQRRIGALDCIGLVLAVAEDLGIRDRSGRPIRRDDYGKYPRQPMDGYLEEECARRLHREDWGYGKAFYGHLLPGRVAILRAPLNHAAIITELPAAGAGAVAGLIHAHLAAGKVAEHRIDEAWLKNVRAIFSFPGVQP